MRNIEKRFNYYVEEITSSEEAAAILTLAEVLALSLSKGLPAVEADEEAKE